MFVTSSPIVQTFVRLLLLGFFSSLLAACQESLPPIPKWQSPEQRQHPDLGRIVDLKNQQDLQPQQLITKLQSARWVLVGERHDNPNHHSLEIWLLKALAQQRPQNSLLLEMLTPDQQTPIREVQLGLAKGRTFEDLPKALNWQQGWDWAQYGPLMQYALQQAYAILPANLTKQEIRQIYQNPPQLQGKYANTPAVQEALIQHIRDSHCQLLPESQLPAMRAVQQQRDRRMAERLVSAPQPALLIAGAYHIRRDLGVPLHLADLGHTKDVQVLMLAEAGTQVTAEQADWVWFTPAQPEQDHCAALRTLNKTD